MLRVTLHKKLAEQTITANFSVRKNGISALFGPSGSGKTTIVNMLAGLVKPSSGKIRLNGNWIFNSQLGIDQSPEKRRFGYVFQEGRLFPHLSVRSNLNYGRKLVPILKRRIGFDQVVDLLSIEHLLDRRPARLSGGEKQRVAIGRSLLMSPSLLLMDEPLASLDDQCKMEILPFISHISRDLSLPVVYVSHSLEEIKQLTNDVVMIAGGVATRTSVTDLHPPLNVGYPTRCYKTYTNYSTDNFMNFQKTILLQ